MNKNFILAGLLLLAIVLTNGCWDRRELDNLGLVLALGLDLAPDQKGLAVTAMIAIPSQLGGGGGESGSSGGGQGPGVLLITMEAPSLNEAFNRINTTINREVTLNQNQVFLIGEEMAHYGLKKLVDNFARYREIRRTMLIFVCKGKAAEMLQVQPKLEKNPAKYFVNLASLSQRTGMFPMVTLNDFLKNYEAFSHENYLPLLDRLPKKAGSGMPPNNSQAGQGGGGSQESTSGGGQPPKKEDQKKPGDVRLIGSAIFKKDRMIGAFDIYETQIMLLLNNKFKEAALTIADPLRKGEFIAFSLLAGAPVQIQYRSQNKVDYFKVKLKLEANLINIQSRIDYTKPKLEDLLGRAIARELKNRVDKTIKKAQQDFNSDVFGFGEAVRKTFLTSPAYERYRWPDKFKDSLIETEVRVNLRRVGVQFQPLENR